MKSLTGGLTAPIFSKPRKENIMDEEKTTENTMGNEKTSNPSGEVPEKKDMIKPKKKTKKRRTVKTRLIDKKKIATLTDELEIAQLEVARLKGEVEQEKPQEGYQWKDHECNSEGIPFSKDRAARLEIEPGKTKKFRTQKELDRAWATGWYEPGRPETVDIDIERIQWPEKEVIEGMSADQLNNFVVEKGIPGTDTKWGFARLKRFVVDYIDYSGD